ncbi:MAG TPA: hypothetical protein DDW52_24240 [Planctomycetaceae bacterium]|nr:hypothetical protein [Planctomycetaceae bacterium]
MISGDFSFEFQWSSVSVVISLLALPVVLLYSYLTWQRSGFRRGVFLLEWLRIAIVVLCLLMLNQPETVREFSPTERPVVAVLVDRSDSMTTQDAGLDSGKRELVRRDEAIAEMLKPATWAQLQDESEVVIVPFGQGAGATDIFGALRGAREDNPSLRVAMLASDGDWNSGPAPVEAALRYRQSGVPILTVPVGSKSRLPDLDIVSFDVPTFGVTGKNVRLPFTIESSLPRDHAVSLKLTTSAGETLTHDIVVSAMGRTSDALVWKPEAEGDYTLTLEMPEHPDELVAGNNSREAPIAIREEKLRVLVVESLPRWEYRYLRNALSRDPGVEVSCLLFHPGLSKVGGGNRDYIPAFPQALEDLAEYDVVFLGDVGVGEKQLTEEQCELLKGLVEQQASGLVFMPGMRGNMLTLEDSPLAELLPVTFDGSQPRGWGTRTPSHFALTELGRRSLLTKLADTADANIQVWENLPGFQWHAPVIRAKAGTDTLAVHQDTSNQYGRLPLLVTRTFGRGKILFMGTDGAWRWRRGVEDLYHYRFWGQVVRWMAYQRNMAEGQAMRFYYSPEQPEVRQTISLSANVMEESGEPLASGDVSVRFVSPSGQTDTVKLLSSGSQWGAFSGSFTPSEPGKYQTVLRCKQTGAEIETTIFVGGRPREQVGKPARPEVLEELARVTGGKQIDAGDVDAAIAAIRDVPSPPPVVRRVRLWAHPLSAGGLIALLGAFWIGRKIIGMI